MLFAVGGILLLPLFNNSVQTKNALEDRDISSAETFDSNDYLSMEKWESTVTSQSITFAEQTYFGQSLKVISTAEELAALSYLVATGDTQAASDKYLLTADINLIDKLWTPIGNSTTPFTGEFYGQLHTISGIVVAESSTIVGSGVGLFGNVTGSLVDICVDNLVVLNSPSVSTTGALVGVLDGAGEILNCFDLRSVKNNYYTVGQATLNTLVFRGGSTDGVNATYKTSSEINDTVTFYSYQGGASGYVGVYNVSGNANASFRKDGDASFGYNGSSYAQSVKVALTSSLSPKTVRAFAFASNTPVLRYQAEGNGKVYIINEGYKATVPALSYVNGLISKITFTSASTQVTVNYSYGRTDAGVSQTKTVTQAVPYDKDWKNYFDLTRIGYTLGGIYKDSSFNNAYTSEKIELLANGGASATVYLKWVAKQNATLKLFLGWTDGYSSNGDVAFLPFESDFTAEGVTLEAMSSAEEPDNTPQNFLKYDGNSSFFSIIICNGQRHSFAIIIYTKYDKLSCLCFFCNKRRFNFK